MPRCEIATVLVLSGILGLCGLSGNIHEKRTWTFKSGDAVQLEFVNAYGDTAYFYKGKAAVNAPIFHLVETDQADIIIWSRQRDKDIFNQPAQLGEFTVQFRKDVQELVDGELQDPDWKDRTEPEFYAIYYSASWCGPCKRFSPKLVQNYTFYKEYYRDRFEVVLCSSDRSKGDMVRYMEDEGMPWYANWRRRDSGIWRKYSGNGIPCLVIVDPNGYLYAHSYNGGEYLGPDVPMGELRQLLAFASNNPDERLSVPTPGVDLSKLAELIRFAEADAKRSKSETPPKPVLTTMSILDKLCDPGEEETLLLVNVALDDRGFVQAAELVTPAVPELQEAVRQSLALWHFMPRITAGEGAVASKVQVPIRIRIQDRYLLPAGELANQ